MIKPGSIIEEDSLFSNLLDDEYSQWLKSLDAILVLGGGVPLSPTEPPVYVQRRCDAVARLFDFIKKNQISQSTKEKLPSVVCLSAGTAHLPQFITPHNGLPLWESTASAAYLMQHGSHPIPEKYVYAETTSYDTISNAFYTRTSFTDIAGWRKLLVVTNEFHIERSKAIFDWIFHAPSTSSADNDDDGYDLYYLSCNNIGLTSEAIETRKEHEKRGEINVKSKLATEYVTLREIWEFLTTDHDFYAASKLAKRGTDHEGSTGSKNLLKLSYGQTKSGGGKLVEYNGGKVILSIDSFALLAVSLIFIGVICSMRCKNVRWDTTNRNVLKFN
ncbi:hypothetical protein ACHAXS_010781 [Conticribra weissflogii]